MIFNILKLTNTGSLISKMYTFTSQESRAVRQLNVTSFADFGSVCFSISRRHLVQYRSSPTSRHRSVCFTPGTEDTNTENTAS